MYDQITTLADAVDKASLASQQVAMKLFLAKLDAVMPSLRGEDLAVVKAAIQELRSGSPLTVWGAWKTCRGPILEAVKRAERASQTTTQVRVNGAGSAPVGSARVFVVHGRNERAREALFSFLRAIGLQPTEWSQALELTGKAAPYVGEILDAAFRAAQAVVVLLTPDDYARLREAFVRDSDPEWERVPTPQARPNVLFEAGMAFGRFPDRSVLVELGDLRPFSDIAGRHVVRLNNTVASRQGLAARLKMAGCAVDTSGTDWHREGDFEGCIQPSEQGTDAEWRNGQDGPDTEAGVSESLSGLPGSMQKLLAEMKQDVEADATGLVREFALVYSRFVGFSSNKARFLYYMTEHHMLCEEVDLLAERGLVQYVTSGETPIYRMSEAFISQLRAWNP